MLLPSWSSQEVDVGCDGASHHLWSTVAELTCPGGLEREPGLHGSWPHLAPPVHALQKLTGEAGPGGAYLSDGDVRSARWDPESPGASAL